MKEVGVTGKMPMRYQSRYVENIINDISSDEREGSYEIEREVEKPTIGNFCFTSEGESELQ